MISFNVPPCTGKEIDYISQAVAAHKICGDGEFTKKCNAWIAIYGAKLVFVDIRPDTMNIDETKIEAAITDKTRVILAMHYAGVACEMDTIMDIARRHGLLVVEDAAQAVMSTYKGKALGTIGDLGCYSFHETKNYSMGEGGAVVVNRPDLVERAEILREKGTNRSKFFRGQVDKYTWVDIGDSFLPSELNAAYLWAQLEMADEINNDRLHSWQVYDEAFRDLRAVAAFFEPFVLEARRVQGFFGSILRHAFKIRDFSRRGKMTRKNRHHQLIHRKSEYNQEHDPNANRLHDRSSLEPC